VIPIEKETRKAKQTNHDACDAIGSGLQTSASAAMLPVICLWSNSVHCAVRHLEDAY